MKEEKYVCDFVTYFGFIRMKADDDYLLSIEFISERQYIYGLDYDNSSLNQGNDRIIYKANDIMESAYIQMIEYMEAQRTQFNIPIYIQGTSYQKKVYEQLKNVKYGELTTYAKLAEMAGAPRAYRPTGYALSKNKFPFIIPCHRVIREDGDIGGYIGGIAVKFRLIMMENPENSDLVREYYKKNGKISYLKTIL